MLAALADELEQGEALLQHPLAILVDTQVPEEFLVGAKDEYCEFTTRVAGVADAIGLTSLQVLMSFIDANVSTFAELPGDARNNRRAVELIQRWPSTLARYLREPGDEGAAEELHAFLLAQDWPWTVEPQQLKRIIQDVKAYAAGRMASALSEDDDLVDPSEQDVSVKIPDDISPKLLVTFQQELPESTAELSRHIQKLFDKKATLEDITEARRVAHTLKGAANIVGVTGIANITHYLEDILEFLVKKNSLPSNELTSFLIEAADCLEIMSEAALGLCEPPPQALQILNGLLAWKRKFTVVENLDESEFLQAASVDADTETAEQSPAVPVAADNTQAADKKAESTPAAALRIQGTVFDKLLDLTGELSSSNLLTRNRLEHILKNAETLNRHNRVLHHHMNALQDLIFTEGLKRSYGGGPKLQAGGDFDPLEMDQYNELHSMVNVFAELLDDVGDVSKSIYGQLGEIRELLNQQDQFNKELDQTIMAERLVSVRTILPRLERSVRQTCRVTEKRAELIVRGESLNLDDMILEMITDPLLHILRNAVDHGIEPVEERESKGKPETAEIALSFERIGNNIVIRCKDDGKGIDAVAVKNKALQIGLIRPDQIVSEKELFDLILQPGFSTSPGVNQVSGRGVGMDVVAKRIADLRGNLSIHSEEGKGTEFVITVPQLLLKAHVVLLRTDDLTFGILSGSFEQIINLEQNFFIESGGTTRIRFNNQTYEIQYLAELLGIRGGMEVTDGRNRAAILVNDNGTATAVLIDEAVANGELVIKKIGRYMPRIGGMIGTVLTADGTAAPVFDVKDLLRRPSRLVTDYLQQHREERSGSAVDVLIVDDSSSARRSLSQAAKDAGFDVRTAIDGVEAITLIEQKRPDLVLTDLEMPKMNGLELAAHLRAADNTRDLPIVMVTSRSTEKHKAQAISTGVNSYITKPFTNDDLIYEMHQLLGRN
jgi:chemosensory pili system protein ChpA (sensor histidine kinase/response regulator)